MNALSASPGQDFTYASSSSSLSEDDLRDEDFNIEDLYEYIGAPNPLPEDKKVSSSDIHTVHNLALTKLPEEIYNAPTVNKNNIEEVTLCIDNLKLISEDFSNKLSPTAFSQTLFSLYPRNDPRLVYSKYKYQGDWEMKTKFYASYLVNIANLIKSNQAKSQQAPSRELHENIEPKKLSEGSLKFDSMFESGNLFAAYKTSESEYDLILQNDVNSRGNIQWFFFSVSNTKKARTVKFNIVNLLKPESLFNEGMKPVVFSSKDYANIGEGWRRAGSDISYYRNMINKEGDINKTYYTLTFNYTFKHDNDTVYFAHSFPYTYSNLKDFLKKTCNNLIKKMYKPLNQFMTRKFLAFPSTKVRFQLNSLSVDPYCILRKNAFFYGNATEDNPYNPRIFPMLMSKMSKYISFDGCRFVVQKSKQKTARVALWKELQIDNVFTLEASFYGYTQGETTVPFTKEDYRNIGADLAKTLYVYLKDITFDIPTIPIAGPLLQEITSAHYLKRSLRNNQNDIKRRSLSTNNEANTTKNKQMFLKNQDPSLLDGQVTMIDCKNLVEELKTNRQLVDIGNKAEDTGSDTDNSEDEISDKDLKKILPVKSIKKIRKKKSKDHLKKKSFPFGKREEKKEEEADKTKQLTPVKVDTGTYTVEVRSKSEKFKQDTGIPSLTKTKAPLKKMFRDYALKERFSLGEQSQEELIGAKMVSKGSQTEDTWFQIYEDQDTSLERQLANASIDGKGFSYGNLSQKQRSINSAIMVKRENRLYVVGEKAGIDHNGGIDFYYKLGKNQISRSTLVKLQPKSNGNQSRREQVGNSEQHRKIEIIRNENIQFSDRKTRSVITKIEGGSSKGQAAPTESLQYYLCYKEVEPKINPLAADYSNRDSNFTTDKLEESRHRQKRDNSNNPINREPKESFYYKKSVSLKNLDNKDLSPDPHTPMLNYQNPVQVRRFNLKDKPPAPLPRLLRMSTIKVEGKDPVAALTTDLSGLINNSKKGGNVEEKEENSLFKAKLSKVSSHNITIASLLASSRDNVPERAETKREKSSLALIREYSLLSSRISDRSREPIMKEHAKTAKKEKSTKYERVLLSDVKYNVEKMVELDSLSSKGRKSQNNIIRKI